MDTEMNQTSTAAVKKSAIAIGWRYALFGLVVTAVQLISSLLIRHFAGEWAANNPGTMTFALVILAVEIIGFPLIYLLTRKVPAQKREQHSMSFGKLITCIFINAGLVGIGTVIGLIVHFTLTLPFGTSIEDLNVLGSMMMSSGPFLRILAVGILAPIFEELIFRKLLIDRIAPHSEIAAILMSGLMFGLFHGNFQQFFFAALLGLFFAFIYVRTGKIWYTILFHMIINLSSSVVTIFLSQKMQEVTAGMDLTLSYQEIGMKYMSSLPIMLLYLGWLGLLFGSSIIGIIILIIKRNSFRLSPAAANVKSANLNTSASVNDNTASNVQTVDTASDSATSELSSESQNKSKIKAALSNWGIWMFYLVCIFLFLWTYLPGIISTIIK